MSRSQTSRYWGDNEFIPPSHLYCLLHVRSRTLLLKSTRFCRLPIQPYFPIIIGRVQYGTANDCQRGIEVYTNSSYPVTFHSTAATLALRSQSIGRRNIRASEHHSIVIRKLSSEKCASLYILSGGARDIGRVTLKFGRECSNWPLPRDRTIEHKTGPTRRMILDTASLELMLI